MRNLRNMAVALVLASLATTPAYAGPHSGEPSPKHGGRGMKQLEMLEDTLELTAQQQTEFRAIVAESRKGMADREKELQVNRAAIRDTFAEDALNDSHLRELLHRQSELQTNRMVEKRVVHTRIKQVLTMEQQAKWEEFRRQRMEHRIGHARNNQWREPGHGEPVM